MKKKSQNVSGVSSKKIVDLKSSTRTIEVQSSSLNMTVQDFIEILKSNASKEKTTINYIIVLGNNVLIGGVMINPKIGRMRSVMDKASPATSFILGAVLSGE